MDNYPLGAANDPRAPWNQSEERETEVRVRTMLTKDTSVWGGDEHTCCECEVEPDGSRSYVSFTESDADVTALFRDQQKTPVKLIEALEKIIRQLKQDYGLRWYAHCNLDDLLCDCQDWNEEELEVTKI